VIAEIPQLVNQQGGATGLGIWILMAIMAVAFVIWGVNQGMEMLRGWREMTGRKPPLDDTVAKQAAALENLKEELKDMAPAEKVDALIEKLAHFVERSDFNDAREEIRAIELLLPTFITRKELDLRIDRFEEYQHKATHALREEIQGNRAVAEAQREGLHNRMNVLTEVLYELRGIMRRKAPEVLS
jgi:hypothetical protein